MKHAYVWWLNQGLHTELFKVHLWLAAEVRRTLSIIRKKKPMYEQKRIMNYDMSIGSWSAKR